MSAVSEWKSERFALRRRARRAQGGFTLIETTVVLGTMSVALLGVLGSHVSTSNLNRTNHETIVASQAVRSRMETIAAADVSQLVALYDAVTANDPGGAGTAPGAAFTVANVAADSLGRRGSVELPLVGGLVREDVVNAELGMPRDLNGDGAVDSLDHTLDFKILPVIVRLRWKGVSADREVKLSTVVYR